VRRAAKRDITEPAIKDALEGDGWEVTPVSDESIPDLLCSKRGVWMIVECKSRGGTLTEKQKAFIQHHRSGPVFVCETAIDAVRSGQWVLMEYGDKAPRVTREIA
jgi:hypothetical protein